MLWRMTLFLCPKPSNLVQASSIQHVFKWGIGNKFRSVNRYSPVHVPRPKEVTIPADYFESPDPVAIHFDRLNEQWEVYWFEHSKLNAKPFPIKKFGVSQSKAEAVLFLQELKNSDRFAQQPPMLESQHAFWDERMQTWFSGSVGFSATKHGVETAKQLAEKRTKNGDIGQWRDRLKKLMEKRRNS